MEDSHESPQLRQTCCVKKEVCYFVRLGAHNKILKNMFLPVFEALRSASRVVGGANAGFGRFPWMALVRGTHTRYCFCGFIVFLQYGRLIQDYFKV